MQVQPGQTGPFGGAQEPAVETCAADRLAGFGVVLEDQHVAVSPPAERGECRTDVGRHRDRPHSPALVARVSAVRREAVLEAQRADAEVDVPTFRSRISLNLGPASVATV
jgi:hypothetical protein